MVYGQSVAVHTETADDTEAGRGEPGVVAEVLALVHIGDMHLDDGCGDSTDAVVQGDTGVGIGTGIEHDAVVSESHLLHLVDEFSLHIALIVVYLHAGIALPQLFETSLKGVAAIDARFAFAQQVEVGTVDNLYLHLVLFMFRECSEALVTAMLLSSCSQLVPTAAGVQHLKKRNTLFRS